MLSSLGINQRRSAHVSRSKLGKEMKKCEESLHFVAALHFYLEIGEERGVKIVE
jgi:hypothetical protein